MERIIPQNESGLAGFDELQRQIEIARNEERKATSDLCRAIAYSNGTLARVLQACRMADLLKK
jgi:hypothetical protein